MIAKRGLEMREVIAAIVPRRGIVIIGHEAISQRSSKLTYSGIV